MRKIQKAMSEELDTEFDVAIEDLTRSRKIAINRMALRAQLETTIADAEKVTQAAELLRAIASYEERNQTSLVPGMLTMAPTQQDTWIRSAGGQDGDDEVESAGDSFEREWPQYAQLNDEKSSTNSLTTMPILELFDEFGGFVKR